MCSTLPAGSTVNIQLYKGASKMDMISASSTPAQFTLTTNNQLSVNDVVTVDLGTPATSPTTVMCTVNRTMQTW